MIKELAEKLINAAMDAETPEDPRGYDDEVAPFVLSTLRLLADEGALPEGYEIARAVEDCL